MYKENSYILFDLINMLYFRERYVPLQITKKNRYRKSKYLIKINKVL